MGSPPSGTRGQDQPGGPPNRLLRALVIDVEHDHNTRDIARRLAKMFVREVFVGRDQPPPTVTEFPNADGVADRAPSAPTHLAPRRGKEALARRGR